VVQSKIRRFIAIKHSQERRKVKHAFAVMGAWQLLYWLLLLLLLCATINERSGGALNDYSCGLAQEAWVVHPVMRFTCPRTPSS
jgi:hypothetical protein